MGLTVTNTNTMQLLGILNRTENAQTDVITQLSTGLRINKGSDDPAGLIALKSLEAEITSVDGSIANNQRTDAVLGVADTALGEVHSLLTEIQTLVMASSSDANLSSSELSANQSQIDDAIIAIDRIIRTTSFNGKRLLDGSGGIQTTVNSSTAISDLRIFGRGNLSADLKMEVQVSTAASKATAVFAIMSDGVTGPAAGGGSTAEFAITGSLGTATIQIGSGLTGSQVAIAINAATDQTGVRAVLSQSSTIYLQSHSSGSANFISVDSLNGVVDLQNSGQDLNEVSKTSGVDASGLINGQAFTADGQKVSFNVGGISGEFTIGTAFTTGSSEFTVSTTGGFTFQLGSESSTRSTIGIDALYSYKLGGTDVGGYLNSLGSGGSADLSSASNRATALNIVKDAINDVAVSQGRIGGFQKFQVQTALNTLQASKTSLSEAKSVIADTDYAIATAELNKQSVLLNSGIGLLGLANQQASQILSLLG